MNRDRDIERELQNHLDLEVEERREAGDSEGAARLAAQRTLGSRALLEEDMRDVWRSRLLADFVADLRYGARLLRRHPTFAVVAIVTLAVGIGANTAMFSAVDAVLLRPLPLPRSDRLVMAWEDVNLPSYKNARNTPSPGNFADWRAQSTAFQDLAAIGYRSWSVTGEGEPSRVEGEAVSGGFFRILGVAPVLGRALDGDDDRPGAPKVAVLGYGLWASQFGGIPTVIGREVRLNDEPYTIVGVMPKDFRFPDSDDQLWIPLALTPAQLANHGSHFLRVIGRLRDGIAVERAQGELAEVARRTALEHPDSNTGVGVRVVPLVDDVVGDVRPALLVLLAAVGLVLLMVCANVGNLLLARAAARSHEFSMRRALGAGGTRIVRQLLTESLLLAAAGGLVGLLVAWWGVAALRSLAPAGMPRAGELDLYPSVYFFNLAISLAAGMVAGVMPAWHVQRSGHQDALSESRSSAASARARLRDLLVIAQAALGVVVLVGAGLLIRSFVALRQIPVGFNTERVLTARVILPLPRYATIDRRNEFYRELVDRIGALPAVHSVSAISFLPLTFSGRTSGVSVDGEPPAGPDLRRFVDFRSVAPGYFQTLSIPLVAGRDFTWDDSPRSRPVVIVSERAARDLWPNLDPIGHRLALGNQHPDGIWFTVIGVAANVRQADAETVPRPAVYFPAMQDQGTGDTLRDWVIQTTADPARVAGAVRATVGQLDPTLPVTRIQTMGQIRQASLSRQQFDAMLVAVFAVVALALAAIGLYGVTAYSISRRTRELGIRIALGARPSEIVGLVLRQGAWLTFAGLIIGTGLSLAVTQLMASLLYGIGPRDPITFATVALVLVTVAAIACYLPTRRGTHIDPVLALRSE